jgi:UPF0271 protein
MPVRRVVDLNADVGEGCGQDAALIPLISSANIACGYHAGDADTMRAAIILARQNGVAVGAHPSFPDRENFGRREMHLTRQQVHDCITAQIGALARIASDEGMQLRHVKPHGALYNMAAHDESLAESVVTAVASVDSRLLLFALAGSPLVAVARRFGLRVINEAFADRAYTANGTLVSRSEPGSVIDDDALVASRAVGMVRDGRVTALDGTQVPIGADTLCVHGDTPGAAAAATRIRAALEAAGITVAAP